MGKFHIRETEHKIIVLLFISNSKVFIVYFDGLDINSCGKYLFADDRIRRKLNLLSNIK